MVQKFLPVAGLAVGMLIAHMSSGKSKGMKGPERGLILATGGVTGLFMGTVAHNVTSSSLLEFSLN